MKPTQGPPQKSPIFLILFISAAVVIVGAFFFPGQTKRPGTPPPTTSSSDAAVIQPASKQKTFPTHRPVPQEQTASKPAKELVAEKVVKFGKIRREMVEEIARRANTPVPPEVSRFFDVLDKGNWQETEAAYSALEQSRTNSNATNPYFHDFLQPTKEAYGAAEQAQKWPPQALLDYGNSILSSLKPGMIYAGGTDAGRFIPTLLNETGDGDQHMIITQNALADGSYLKYLEFRYGDQMKTLTSDDSQKMFQEYLQDAQARMHHDIQFPDEPKQLKPGEDIKITDNRIQVSGEVAVMGINEKLLQLLMSKNPDSGFALQESFPLDKVQASASLLGPIMQVGGQDSSASLTQESAAQSVDYWRTEANQLISNPDIPEDSAARDAYAKLIAAQASLLAQHNLTTEAEQELQIADNLNPANSDVVFRYVNLLLQLGRSTDAVVVADRAAKAAPDNQQFQSLVAQTKALTK